MTDTDFDTRLGRVLRSALALPAATQLDAETAAATERTAGAIAAAAHGRDAARRGVAASSARRPAARGRVRPGADLPAPAGPTAAYILYPAPWGDIHVAASAGGIVALELRSSTEAFVEDVVERTGGAVVPDQEGVPASWRATLARARTELDEYFAGERTSFDLAVDLRGVSDWDRRVLEGAARLAYGEVTSYGRLARRIGQPRAARAVGGALGRNPIPIVIPCHRILAWDGTLGGYGGGGHGSRAAMLDVKRTLLALEGVPMPAPALAG